MMPRALFFSTAILLLAIIGLGGYALLLKRNVEESAQHVDTRPVAPPPAGPTETVVLYIAADDTGQLQRREITLGLPAQPNERARELLHALLGEYLKKLSPHELASGADVKNVYFLPNNMAVVDTTAAFADGHRSGIFVETLSVASVVETLATNLPNVNKVKILVDGKERETLAGHADLTSFYDVAQVSELVKQLQ